MSLTHSLLEKPSLCTLIHNFSKGHLGWFGANHLSAIIKDRAFFWCTQTNWSTLYLTQNQRQVVSLHYTTANQKNVSLCVRTSTTISIYTYIFIEKDRYIDIQININAYIICMHVLMAPLLWPVQTILGWWDDWTLCLIISTDLEKNTEELWIVHSQNAISGYSSACEKYIF